MSEETTQDQPEPTDAEAPEVDGTVETGTEAEAVQPEPAPAEVEQAQPDPAPTQPAVEVEQPQYQPPAELAEIESAIDAIDPLDTDSVKSVLKKTLGIAANATQRAAIAEQRSQAAGVHAERERAFTDASRRFGVTKTEAEKLYDQRVAALAKQGFKGSDLVMRATAQWEYALEQRKDQPPAKPKAIAPATPVTRGGAAALPKGGTAPPPPAKAKPIADKVRSGDYGALENL